jgi:hypothetical protein
MQSPKLFAITGTVIVLAVLFVLLFVLAPVAKLAQVSTRIGRRLALTSPVPPRHAAPE